MPSHNEATRMLQVIRGAVDQTTKSGAKIEQTYGQVFGLSEDGREASVYLAGSRELAESDGGVPEPSDGFRVPSWLNLAESDYVRVAIDDRGHRWVEEFLHSSPYSKLLIDQSAGRIYLGDGTAPATNYIEYSGGSIVIPGIGVPEGTSFPPSPNDEDRYYRTDLHTEFFWNDLHGHWMSTTLYNYRLPEVTNLAADSADVFRAAIAIPTSFSDIWLIDWVISVFHVAAGTALSGSHYWQAQLRKLGSAGTVNGVYSYFAVNSGASGVWRAGTQYAIDALLGPTHAGFLSYNIAKNGTPGNFYFYSTLTYRLVAT